MTWSVLMIWKSNGVLWTLPFQEIGGARKTKTYAYPMWYAKSTACISHPGWQQKSRYMLGRKISGWIFRISGRSLFATYILYRLVKWHVPSPDTNLKSNNNNNKKANNWVILERRAFSPRHPKRSKRSSATEQGNKCEYGTSAPWFILQTRAPEAEFLHLHTFYPMALNAK